jgi:hypothetical protein
MRTRTTPRRRRSARLTTALTLLSVALLTAACGATPASVAPSVAATPVVTPDPRLPDPTTADDVFRAIGAQGLRLTASNAVTGTGTLVKRINASFGGWPLTISEFTSAQALTDRLKWDGEPPGGGEPAVAVAGSNILITWGPTSNGPPVAPDAARAARLVTLAETLHALLGPVQVRAIVRLPIPSVPPGSTAAGDASPAPSAEPEE